MYKRFVKASLIAAGIVAALEFVRVIWGYILMTKWCDDATPLSEYIIPQVPWLLRLVLIIFIGTMGINILLRRKSKDKQPNLAASTVFGALSILFILHYAIPVATWKIYESRNFPSAKNISKWRTHLASPDVSVRIRTLLKLKNNQYLGEVETGPDGRGVINPFIPLLVDALNDEEASVRIEAAEALAKIGYHAGSAGPDVLRRLNIEQAPVRQACIKALALIHYRNKNTIPYLIEGLEKHPEYEVRYVCAARLGELGADAEQAIPALITALQDTSENSSVRGHAARALREIRVYNDQVAAALDTASNDPDENVRGTSVDARKWLIIWTKAAAPEQSKSPAEIQ